MARNVDDAEDGALPSKWRLGVGRDVHLWQAVVHGPLDHLADPINLASNLLSRDDRKELGTKPGISLKFANRRSRTASHDSREGVTARVRCVVRRASASGWDRIASCAVQALAARPDPQALSHAINGKSTAANAQDGVVPVE